MTLLKICHINQMVEAVRAGTNTEKKTPDLSVPPQDTEITKIDTPSISKPPVENTTPNTPPSKVEVPTPTPPKVTKKKSSFNLDSILDEVEEEEKNEQKRSEAPNTAEAKKVWNTIAQHTKSPSLKEHLLRAVIKMNGDTLVVKVGTGISLNTIRAEQNLPEDLRIQLNFPALLMEIILLYHGLVI